MRGRPFKPGQSGNPAGKPKGCKARKTILREALLKQGIDLKKMTPLEFVLLEMRNPRNRKQMRIHCADSALPYTHQKLPQSTVVEAGAGFQGMLKALAEAARSGHPKTEGKK